MISDNKQGNPYHDESGQFTSGSGSAESVHDEKNGKISDKLGEMGFIPGKEEPKAKFTVETLGGEVLGEVEASSEEEAFELASQQFPGLGDELTVTNQEAEGKLGQMGFGGK